MDSTHTRPVAEFSEEAKTFNWLLGSFTTRTAGVELAIAVSSDGLLMAKAAKRDRGDADRLGAVVSGMTSLAAGTANWYRLGDLTRIVVDLEDGYLLVTTISRGSVLGVIASRSANLSTVAYEMTLFGSRAGATLTPGLIAELNSAVQM
ncbi:roadblock/LC7 domain-containing protein [Actinoplanes sp. TRM 88003]|uniref:Roadblock/LC7 domain-containing protein n=1 Tax=Paractinoplanes aksuensis TaxID=2939490 RepID=A0ABT1DWZ6_9ACTN|nr:roadblock/LC7 domain-containing protein [Actinoplanes aksuensis]MCO8275387.1 roadblock/LC7 domain-containing protein [Actinoplanes aksuensis]